MARSGSSKLILAEPRSENLFFDLRKDPLEMNNLFSSPQYRDEVQKMTAALSAWRCKDPKPQAYQDQDAPQVHQPNVPPHDLSHRDAIIQYYRDRMQTLQVRK